MNTKRSQAMSNGAPPGTGRRSGTHQAPMLSCVSSGVGNCTTSPTATASSSSRKTPVITSRTRVWEPKPTEEISEEELKAVMQAGEISNVLEEDERDMIEGVFELRHTYAEEIMIPAGRTK